MGIGKTGVLAADQHIAGQRHFKATGDGDAVDGTNHRLAGLFDGLHWIVVRAFRVGGAQALLAEFLQIEAGRKGSGAGAGEHDGAHIVISFQFAEHAGQIAAQRLAQRVHRLRPVQCDVGNRPITTDQNDIFGHAVPSLPRTLVHCAAGAACNWR